MSSIRQWILPTCFLVFLAGCAISVQYEYNNAPYGSWRTFAWQAPEPTPIRNPVVDSGILTTRVQQAVVATLTTQGYRQVQDPAEADFLVTYHTTIENRTQNTAPSVGFSYGWWSAPFSTVIVSQPTREVREADLILDIKEAKSNKLVWRGWLTSSLRQSNYSPQAVNSAVARILAKFPPPPKL